MTTTTIQTIEDFLMRNGVVGLDWYSNGLRCWLPDGTGVEYRQHTGNFDIRICWHFAYGVARDIRNGSPVLFS